MTDRDKLMELIEKKFPKVWVKPGERFRNSYGNQAIWSGEGSYMPDGSEAFDMYGPYSRYEFGVHKDLLAFVQKHGWYWEAYDGGTYFAYPE